jgi:hypothetical protein
MVKKIISPKPSVYPVTDSSIDRSADEAAQSILNHYDRMPLNPKTHEWVDSALRAQAPFLTVVFDPSAEASVLRYKNGSVTRTPQTEGAEDV